MKAPMDPRFLAAVDMIGRSGSNDFQIRYSDDEEPVVWIAVANYGERIKLATNYDPALHSHVAGVKLGAGLTPLQAVMDLLKGAFDGGTCTHCGKTTGVTDDFEREQPLDKLICWYVYDPKSETFRRSCEEEDRGGR